MNHEPMPTESPIQARTVISPVIDAAIELGEVITSVQSTCNRLYALSYHRPEGHLGRSPDIIHRVKTTHRASRDQTALHYHEFYPRYNGSRSRHDQGAIGARDS